jgi:hypothetical protein
MMGVWPGADSHRGRGTPFDRTHSRGTRQNDCKANQTGAYQGKRGGLRHRAGPGAVLISSCCRDIKNLLATTGIVQPGNVHAD